MDNLGILVQAILSLKDTKASKDQIASELPKLESQLQSDKNTRVKIVAGLDIAKSKSLIQSQLNTLTNQAKAPTIKVGIDTSGFNSVQGATQNITNGLQTVQTQAQQTASAVREVTNSVSYDISDNAFNRLLKDMQIGKNVTDEYKASIRTLANQLNESWNTYNLDKYNQALNGLINKLDSGQARMRSFTSDNAELTRVTEELKVYQASIGSFSNKENRLKFYIDPKFKEELVYVLGSIEEVKSALTSMYGVGNWTFNPNKQIEGFQNLVNYIDKSDAGLSHFGKTLFETFSQAQAGGNNFAGFFADVVNKVRTLRDTLNFKATPISEILSSTDTATATRAIEDMIAKAINLSNYEERNRDVFRGFYEEVTTDSVVMTNDLNNVATAAQNVQRAMTPSDKNYFSNSSAILRNIQYFNEEENAVRSLEQTFTSLGATVTSIERKNSSGFLDAFTVSVRSASGEVENFNYRWKNLNAGIEGADPDWKYALSNITATDKYIQKLAESAKIAQDKLNAMADTMQQKLLSTYMGFGNGSKPIVNAEHWEELAKQADVAGNAIERLRTADSTTSASIKANADIEIQKLKDLARSYQNAEYAANSLRTKGVTTTKKIETDELNRFINKINDSNVPINKLRRHIEILKSSLSNVTDSQSLVKYLDNFSRVEAKFNSLKALYQTIGGYDKQLDKLAKDWQKQGIYVGNVKTTIESLKTSLANVNTSDGLTTWISDFNSQISNISKLPIEIAKYKQEITATRDEWKSQGIYVGEIQAKVTSLARSLPNIKKPEKFNEWVQEWNDINQKANQLKVNLDSQVATHNKIYEIQAQIAKLNPTKDSAEIARLNEKLSAEQKTLSNLQMQSNVYSNLVSLEQQEQYITEQTVKSRDKLLSATNTGVKQYQTTITNAITELQGIANSAVFRKNASNPEVARTKQDINSLITAYQNLATKLQGNITPAGLETVRTELTQLNARFNDATTTAKRFETELRNDNSAEQLSQKVALLTSRIKAYRQANSKSEKKFGSQYDSMLSQLANPNIDLNTYNAINKQFQVMRQEINAANVAGKNLWQTLKEKVAKFTGWMSMTYAISLATRTIRSMVTDVVELDTALIDLKKTFKGTNEDLKEFYYEANNVAKQLGVTTQEVINTASSWSRLGYNTKEAAVEMSKYASMFKIISPNMSIEDSTDGLLSVMKAFDIGVNDVLDGIMSKINKVGNEFGTSNNEIVQMLMRSSSAMKEGNNTLAETIALETSAVEITRDYASVGTAYKTLAMRLRGYDEELETYSNDVQVLSGEIANLTKTAKNPSGVSLFKDEAKTEYKSTLEILRDIREVYDDLDDKTQAQLLEKIAGKRQGQIVAATLDNWDTVEKALVAMENADGSALNEMNTVMESISYRVNTLKETLVGIAQGSFSQKFMMSIVDSGIRVLNVFDDLSPSISFILEKFASLLELVTKLADTIGGIPLLIAGIGLKNVGSPKMFGLVLICQQ